MNDASIYAYLSMQEAIKDSGLSEEVYQNNPRVGLIAGSGGSSKAQVFGADAMRSPRGLKAVGPYVVTKAMGSAVSACLATPFKIHGVNYSISSACATSAHCIGNAVEQIQLGKQDIVFAGGGEELGWEMACEFDAMGALSTKYNETPAKASRTYDAHRDGFVIAGGGVETFAEAVKCLKPGGKIGNVNYLGSGDTIDIPRTEWGVGMGHKQINGGLMPGGRLRMEKLGALVSAGKLDVSPLSTHVFKGWDHLEEALFLMRDKPADLIKPVVVIEE